jgi:hypothetical protein
VNVVNMATLLFSGQKITSPTVTCGKVHCHDGKSTCPVKGLIFFNECWTINVPKCEGRLLGQMFVFEGQIHNGQFL